MDVVEIYFLPVIQTTACAALVEEANDKLGNIPQARQALKLAPKGNGLRPTKYAEKP